MLLSAWLGIFGLATACGGGGTNATGDALSARAEQGRHLVETEGCAACHGGDGQGVVGPALAGLLGTEVELEDGSTMLADDAYVTRSILAPDADVRAGFAIAMPANTLSEDDAAAILAYLKELP